MYNSGVYLAVNIDIGVFVCFDNRIYNRALKRDLAKGNKIIKCKASVYESLNGNLRLVLLTRGSEKLWYP